MKRILLLGMHILLCAATAIEIQPTTALLASGSAPHRIDVLITGVGVTAATYQLTKRASSGKYDLLLQAGIAGSLHQDVPLLASFLVGSEFLGDLGVEEGVRFQSLFDLGFTRSNEAPWKDAHLVNPHENLLKSAGFTRVKGVTVQEITTRTERLSYYKSSGAQIETMEGAALHYVALLEKIPFLQLRTISNEAGERDKGKWKVQEAIQQLNIDLHNLLHKDLK